MKTVEKYWSGKHSFMRPFTVVLIGQVSFDIYFLKQPIKLFNANIELTDKSPSVSEIRETMCTSTICVHLRKLKHHNGII